MNNQDKYYSLTEIDAKSKGFFAGATISWEKSKEQIWAEMFEQTIKDAAPAVTVRLNTKIISWSVAATLIILIGLSNYFWFYQTTYNCPEGQLLEANLPDGTHFHLNAGSEINYYPYRWKFTRKVKLYGEGYFEVVKGDKFQVVSENAKTVVLGTSFNIYSRDNKYSVTCLTGKVKVMSNNNSEVILLPNHHAELNKKGSFNIIENYQPERAIGWRNNQFVFTAMPIKEVLSEIGRQYGIKIKIQGNINQVFTGNFNKTKDVENVLRLVCTSLSLNFVKKSEKEFIIVPNS